MTRFTLSSVLLIMSICCLVPPRIYAEDISLTTAFNGKMAPLTIKYGEMTPEWRQFMLAPDPASDADLMKKIVNNEDEQAFYLLSSSFAAYYTKGETVTCTGETYLIAYRRPSPIKSYLHANLLRQLSGENQGNNGMDHFKISDLLVTKDTPLNLCLLHLRSLDNFLDIHPIEGQAELGEASKGFTQTQEKARQTQSMGNLKQLALSLLMYAQDHNEILPNMTDTTTLWKALGVPAGICAHPATKETYRANSALSGWSLGNIVTPEDTPLFYEGSAWSDGGRIVVFIDGHLRYLPTKEWERLQLKYKLP